MSYKVYLWDALSPIEWSQAEWRCERADAPTVGCEHEMIRDVVLRHVPRNGLVVDAGCGLGQWPAYLRARGWRCVGLEISRAACAQAHARTPDLPLCCADTRVAPLRTGAADAVLSIGVVEHDEAGPLAGLRELRRIVRTGGVLVVAVPFDNLSRRLVTNRLLDRVNRRRRREGQRLGFVEYRFTRRELRDALRATGFAPFAVYPNDYLPPFVMGPWVDWTNVTATPFDSGVEGPQMTLPGWRGRVARGLLRATPWLVCGEIAMVARAV